MKVLEVLVKKHLVSKYGWKEMPDSGYAAYIKHLRNTEKAVFEEQKDIVKELNINLDKMSFMTDYLRFNFK